MAYDNPLRNEYRAVQLDLGAGAVTFTIPVPSDGSQGRSGRVTNVRLEQVTEAFPALTTLASTIRVGDGTDADLYYDTGNIVSLAQDEDVTSFADDGAKVDIELGRSTITVTGSVNTGGTPAGIADVVVEVEWD